MTQPAVNPYAPPTTDLDGGLGPQSDPSGQIPAERGTRLGAVLLDGLVTLGVALPGGAISLLLNGDGKFLGYGIAGLAVLALGIYQIVLISTTGQSLAKKWLHIKIVKIDGSPVTFGSGVGMRSWLPGLIGAVPYVGSIFSLVDALYIFGDERRCLHDRIAGTKVIVAD